jgi:hypothetical protein
MVQRFQGLWATFCSLTGEVQGKKKEEKRTNKISLQESHAVSNAVLRNSLPN